MEANHAELIKDDIWEDEDIAPVEQPDFILQEDELLSAASEIPVEPTIDDIKLQKIANRLEGDFKRIQAPLSRSAVDHWVLKRNLNPYEMIELSALLKAKGIHIEDGISKAITSPNSNTIDILETDTRIMLRRKTALLERHQEIELGRAIRLSIIAEEQAAEESNSDNSELIKILARGKKARELMVSRNLGLVRLVVNKYKKRTNHLDEDDLFQEGVIGLMNAVEKYDPELGYKFSTYAMWWVRQAITRGLSDKDRAIRVPVHRLEQLNKFRRAVRFMYSEYGQKPSNKRVADALGWTEEFTAFIENLTEVKVISMETPTGGDEDETTLASIIRCSNPTPEARSSERSTCIKVRELVATLSPREQNIINRRFGINELRKNETLQEIGDSYSLTRERIRQIESKALYIMKFRARKTKLLNEIREP